MKSFMDTPSAFDGMPADVGVRLGRIDVSKGREQLHEDQMPELLQALSEQSRVGLEGALDIVRTSLPETPGLDRRAA